jgi:Cu+-exporting ATPase
LLALQLGHRTQEALCIQAVEYHLSKVATELAPGTIALAIDASAEVATAALRSCFHCGETCPDDTFARRGKIFCCHGCQVVHDLLTESGLEQFYDLTRHPGIPMRNRERLDQWSFLDEPALQTRLLDFTDGTQSRVTFHIPAIHCVACVWLLENLFRLHPGVGRSQVNFSKREVAITFACGKLRLSELVTLLASIGYAPALSYGELDKATVHSPKKRQWLQIGVAGFAFGNIMLFSIPQYFGLDSFNGPVFRSVFGWLSLFLALPVVTFSALDYWKSAWLSCRQRIATLDVPIALGLAAIYGQSVYEVVSRTGEGYSDSLCGLIFFLLCGRAFQQRTQERLAFDRDYKSFFPLSVVRRSRASEAEADSAGWTEERVSLAQLKVGDRIVIRNGEVIPADARLVEGSAWVDYSFVTGESEPVAKAPGDYLYAGGQQVGAAIEMETVKAVSQGYLTSLWNHETFQKRREESLNTLTNIFSRRFIWIVITIALGAVAFWTLRGDAARGVKAFTSVLIVACPCALALAAPFTLGTAQRWLSRANTFLKNVYVLERMARITAIVFDKTGTLTSAGVNAVQFSGTPLDARELRSLFSLTRHSTHPHSARIHEFLGNRLALQPVTEFREVTGCGIEGRVDDVVLRLGSPAWFRSLGVSVPETVGKGSLVCLSVNGAYRGTFVLASALRRDADELIRRLAAQHELALLSGDNEREREEFTTLFGSNARLNFNQSPLDKLGFIRGLQQSGHTVMMVGDGLNDAGALKQSDVGIAVVEKVGAFSPASDVILDAQRVPQLFELLRFARRATRIVRLSFGISSAYNVIGVGIAAAGLLSPIVCAVLMPLSSATVVLFACGMTSWAARRSGLRFDPQQSGQGTLL